MNAKDSEKKEAKKKKASAEQPQPEAKKEPAEKNTAATTPAEQPAGAPAGETPVQSGTEKQDKGIRRPKAFIAQGAGSPARQTIGIRRINMTISKVDPMSAIKLGFLVSVALGIMVVIAMMLLWFILDGMHVFANINELFENLSSTQLLQFAEYLRFGRWMSFAVLVGIIHVVLLTALSAICATVYNLIASLVGGLKITVTDE